MPTSGYRESVSELACISSLGVCETAFEPEPFPAPLLPQDKSAPIKKRGNNIVKDFFMLILMLLSLESDFLNSIASTAMFSKIKRGTRKITYGVLYYTIRLAVDLGKL